MPAIAIEAADAVLLVVEGNEGRGGVMVHLCSGLKGRGRQLWLVWGGFQFFLRVIN